MHAAGFYRLTLPRSLGGLQADPLTYIRVVELLAEGAGSGVGWNVANNGVASLITLGLPDDGVQEIFPKDHRSVIAGTAIQGGGEAVPVEGGYRVSGRWTFGSGVPRGRLDARQLPDSRQRRAAPPQRRRPVLARPVPARRGRGHSRQLGRDRARGTGSFDWTVTDFFLPERRTMLHAGVAARQPVGHGRASPTPCRRRPGSGRTQCAVITGLARAGIDALVELAAEKTPRGRTGRLCDNPQVQDAVGRADATPQCRTPLSQRDDRRAVEHARRRPRDHARAARPLPARRGALPPTAPARRWT